MYFGVDYYPEHWPEERWKTDARLMQKAGINIARIAEFAWSLIEPEPGKCDFGWLDRAVATLNNQGIQIMMGTPTSNAPMWFFEQHPEALLVDENGAPMSPGGRYNACHNHAEFRWYVRRLAEEMARHYQGHPGVAGWHLHNEYGSAACYCMNCRRCFHQWLQRRYGTLDALNEAWGNVFWSEEYTSWEQIPTPLPTVAGQNPSLILDYRRFYSDSVVEFAEESLNAVRPYAGDRWILTNCQNFLKQNVDYQDLNRSMNIVATNNYPSNIRGMEFIRPGLDLMRGIKDKGFWVVEQRSGGFMSVTAGRMSKTTRPGELRCLTYQAIGRGMDHVAYFRWRTALFAQEQYCRGILEHDGQPGRLYDEVRQLGKELAELAPFLENTKVQTVVAMLHSYDQRWATSVSPEYHHLNYLELFTDIHETFTHLGIQVDVRPYEADIARYKLVVVPLMYLTDLKLVSRLEEFAEGGGTVVFTFRSGAKHWSSVFTDDVLPGAIRNLTGIQISDYDALQKGDFISITHENAPGTIFKAGRWADIIALAGAVPVAFYADQFYAGEPALTINNFGKGKVYYLGAWPEMELMEVIVEEVLQSAGVPLRWQSLPEAVEVLARSGSKGTLYFILNHANERVSVRLPNTLHGKRELFTKAVAGETIDLPPQAAFIYCI
jgi:beta-galactosidase